MDAVGLVRGSVQHRLAVALGDRDAVVIEKYNVEIQEALNTHLTKKARDDENDEMQEKVASLLEQREAEAAPRPPAQLTGGGGY